MTEFYVRWYDSYDCPHVSKVYFIDSARDRFLVINDESGYFHWVDTADCELFDYDRFRNEVIKGE
jgi:hypothetical protein